MDMKTEALPDVSLMLQSEIRLHELYHGATSSMIPSVRERLRDLVTLIDCGNATLRQKVVDSLVELNLELDDLSFELTEQDLLRLRQRLREDMQDILDAIKNVSLYRPPVITSLKEDHVRSLASQRATVLQHEQTVAAQQQELDDIDKLLATLDKPSVLTALRYLIPEEKDIEVILGGLKDPTVSPELVKAALVKLNQHLDLFEQGRRFADVVQSRGRIANRLGELKQTLHTLQAQLKAAEEKCGHFRGVDELLLLRAPWVDQGNRFVSRWQMLWGPLNDATQVSELLAALKSARDYLVDVRREFEAAA